MIQDLLHALRSLRARPGASAVAVLVLAIGIGANIALFGVVDALLFRPPVGVSDPERVVRVRTGSAGPLMAGSGPVNSYPTFEAVSAERADLVEVAAYGGGPKALDAGEIARGVSTHTVTSNFFDVMGVTPVIGRFFDEAEGRKDAEIPVAVLGWDFWQNEFGGRADALGRSLRVGDVSLTIIGVAPVGFVGADLDEHDFWVPMGMAAHAGFAGGYGPGGGWIQMVGRLPEGLTLDAARARLDAESAGRESLSVIPFSLEDVGRGNLPTAISLIPIHTMFTDTAGETPVPAWALGVSGALLLLACATVANLLLAQAVRRRRDIAVRLALGAAPGRIVRTQLIESSIVALSAAVASAFLAWLSIGLVRKLPTPPLGPLLGGRTLLFGLAVALGTPLLFGLAPALWAARRDVGEVLKKTGSPGPAGFQRGLMAAQIAIAFALLLVGGLFLKSLDRVQAIPLGWDADHTLAIYMTVGQVYSDEERQSVVRAMAVVERIPGVTGLARAGLTPFLSHNSSGMRIEDGRSDEEQPSGHLINKVGPDYFRVLDIPILTGRAFDENDRVGAQPVAIVSQAFARRFLSGRRALGACLWITKGMVGNAFGEAPYGDACAEVVGVAADAKYDELLGESSPVAYLAAEQVPGFHFLTARVDGAPEDFIAPVRAAIQAADPAMPFPRIEPMSVVVERWQFQWRVAAQLFGVLGVLAAVLAAVGVYGLVSFVAAQRNREMGIRAALGAGRERLVRLVLWDGVKVTGIGLLAGAAVALAVARLFASQLYGTSYANPTTYLGVGAALTLVTLAASLRPAARAAGADPAIVLRDE